MKIVVEHAQEEAVIVRCPDPAAPHIQALLTLLSQSQRRIPAEADGERVFLSPADVLYAEAVDRSVYLCTCDAVYRTPLPLAQLEAFSFFRCARTVLVRLGAVQRLRATSGGRILLTLANGERILVSRRYAAALRSRLSDSATPKQKGDCIL